jgi:hypothetical protein
VAQYPNARNGMRGGTTMPKLSFYGLVTDLGNLQTELMKLKRAYPTLESDERYQRIVTSLEQIVSEYEQKNRAFEEGK